MKIHCNRCQGDTNHTVLAQTERNWEFLGARDDTNWNGIPVYLRQRYSIIECKGCEEKTFLLEEDNSFTYGDKDNPPPFNTGSFTIFPPRLFRHLPLWLESIPDTELIALMREVYEALQNDSRRLALMGVRAILDRVISKPVGDKGNFRATMKAYVEQHGQLGLRVAEAIEALFDAGSAAVHRAYDPTDTFTEIIDALEAILYQIYVLPTRTAAIMDATPARAKPLSPKPPRG